MTPLQNKNKKTYTNGDVEARFPQLIKFESKKKINKKILK